MTVNTGATRPRPNSKRKGQTNGSIVTSEARAAFETARVLDAELSARLTGEIRFDRTSRMLYSTDASNYQIEPIGVVIPHTIEDVHVAVEIASSHGVPVLPRGGGSSLAGQTVGAALVIDFSKYLNRILDLDLDAKTVTVEPGIYIDTLNRQLKANGLMFGPDPASSDRATAGGVVGNNSTGSHSILYGMTADHVVSAKIALVEGGTVDLGRGSADELAAMAATDTPGGRLMSSLFAFREKHRDLIARDFPPHWRRATGYSLNEFLKPDNEFNPARLLASSEGTLATTLQLTFGLVPRPQHTGLVLLQFDELVAAMAATPVILQTDPSAVELMDRMLISLTREQQGYAHMISFIEGDPAAVLAVEFYGTSDREVEQKCAHLEEQLTKHNIRLSSSPQRVLDAERQQNVWAVRKAGLGLLMSMHGDAKPIPCIEDVSVPVPHLAEYVGAIEQLVAEHGTTAAFYAHASAGCLHIRPLISLKDLKGVNTMSELTHAAAEMAHRFGGVMSGEHGDGLQRSELNEVIFGSELYQAMREFKSVFDPRKLMNPGKIVDAPPMTENLRYGPTYKPKEIITFLDFSKEGGFMGAVEMCNGAAVCRKLKAGAMCPSYMATRDEKDTTRGRANALRDALAGRVFNEDDFTSKTTYDVLDLCISCKACKTECPSSVDMAKIKTEYLAQYHAVHGVPLRSRMFGHIHFLSKIAAPVAPLANLSLRTPLAKPVMRAIGISTDRNMPPFVHQTFEKRWEKYQQKAKTDRPTRGKVVYYHDTFTNYNYPKIGVAAVKLLEAAGFEVIVELRRACCGRPMLSKGLVTEAKKVARKNVAVLAPHANAGIPIVGTEPSCILTLRDEYRSLLPNDEDTVKVAENSFMLDEFLAKLDANKDLGITWKNDTGPEVLFHTHCHQRSLIGTGPSMAILQASGCRARETNAGCCGMAGSFGYEAEHYDLSRKMGEDRLFPAINESSKATIVAIAGVSCHQQIEHFTDRGTQHIAQVLASRIAPGHRYQPKPETVAAS